MMAVWSILMYQRRQGKLLVLLVHPGGPYWRNMAFQTEVPSGAILRP